MLLPGRKAGNDVVVALMSLQRRESNNHVVGQARTKIIGGATANINSDGEPLGGLAARPAPGCGGRSR